MKKLEYAIIGTLLCLFFLSIPINSLNAKSDDISWDIMQITNNDIVDEHPVIRIDSQNTLHMAWAGGIIQGETLKEDLEIFYAIKKIDSEWKISQLTENKVQDYFPNIVVDSNGYAHLTWWSEVPDQSNEIYYATNKMGSWEIETITQDTVNDIRPSIAINSKGNVSIAWQRQIIDNWDIYYAKQEDDIWVIEPVTEKATNCYSPSIVFDVFDDPYIAWWEQSGDNFQSAEIFYGIPGVGYWKQYQVTGNSFGDRDPILMFDSLHRPRMIWTGQTDKNNVIYAENEVACSCQPWDIFQVTNDEDSDEEPHFIIDNEDRLHLVWERGGKIQYAIGFSESQSWETMVITTGHNPRVSVDQNNEVYITYFDNPEGDTESEIFLVTTNDNISPPQTTTVATNTNTLTTTTVTEFNKSLTITSIIGIFAMIYHLKQRKKS